MSNNKEMFFAGRKNRKSGRLVCTLLALQIGLMALLVPGSVFATEPIDLDPDPDTPPPTTLVVEEGEELDVKRLPPGHYVIVVIEEDGGQRTYEIRV